MPTVASAVVSRLDTINYQFTANIPNFNENSAFAFRQADQSR